VGLRSFRDHSPDSFIAYSQLAELVGSDEESC
jgi:hypothetical protein